MSAVRWPTLTVLAAGIALVALAAVACTQGDASEDAERPAGGPAAPTATRTMEAAPTGVPTAEADTAAVCSLDDHIDRAKAATFQVRTASGIGSAFYIGNGEWLTNHHVVEKETRVTLVHGGASLSAAVEGSLPGYDLALLRAQPPSSVRPLRLAAARPAVSASVAAVGFRSASSWATPSVSRGAVSEHVPFSQFPSKFDGNGAVIEIDADLYPGNSGGPIVDGCGAVVGVATFIRLLNPFVSQGSFGIAAETVVARLTQLRSTAHVARLTADVAGSLSREPAWSPDGRRITFATERDGDSEIYVMNADGSGVTRLTDNGIRDGEPTWSPDGRRIAFASERDGGPEIYVMNADGSDVVRLTDNSALDRSPAWSPDGRRIAFVSENSSFTANIYVMNADGSKVARLTESEAGAADPAWSPDGRKIAFASQGEESLNIYVMNADGSDIARLSDNADANDWDRYPEWSPDGRHIAFASKRDGVVGIYKMSVDGSGLARLTDNAGDYDPAWSPDGRRIAFASKRDGDLDIYVMNADGSGVARLTDNSTWD